MKNVIRRDCPSISVNCPLYRVESIIHDWHDCWCISQSRLPCSILSAHPKHIPEVPTHTPSLKLVKNEVVYFRASSTAVQYQQVQAVVQSVHDVGEVAPL
jgi:hypothetical protein